MESKALTTMTTIKTFQVNGVDVSLSPAMVNKFIANGSSELTEREAVNFVNLCLYNRLNPWVGDAYPVKYLDKQTNKYMCNLIVSKQAFMKQADRNPNRDGFEAGLIVQDKDGNLTDREGSFHLTTDTILGGWCKVYRKDFRVPVTARVLLTEYDKGRSTWKAIRATMIRKVAVAQAHREAFPEEYQGIYMAEEIGHNEIELRKVEGETIRKNDRGETVDIELPSGQIIKTHGITGFTANAIQELTDENNQAMKDLNYFLKNKEAETVLNLTEDEGEELKAILMDRYAEAKMESPDSGRIPSGTEADTIPLDLDNELDDIESDDFDGLADLVEDELEDMVDEVADHAKKSDNLFDK